MTAINDVRTPDIAITRVGHAVARYGLALVIGWIGLAKFMAYEAEGIQPLIASSPLMSWLYDVFSVTTLSTLLGVVEVTAAALLVVKPWLPRLSAVGSVLAIGLFLATVSFLFTTPGVFEESAGGFPWLGTTGGFLVKDVALLGIAVWTLGDSLRAVRESRRATLA